MGSRVRGGIDRKTRTGEIIIGVEMSVKFTFLVIIMRRSQKEKQHVVIVGGGFAGRTALRELRSEFEVTLIETKEYFEYTPSILRCLVEPDHARKIVLPQPRHITVANVVHFDSKRKYFSSSC